LAEAESEASDAESPCIKDVGGGEATPEATSRVDEALLEEEKEEEDRDTYFKWKQKKPEPKELAPKELT